MKGFHGTEEDLLKNLLREAAKQKLEINSCVSIPEKERVDGLVSALVGSDTGEADDDKTEFLISQCEDKNSSQSQPIHFLIVEVIGSNTDVFIEEVIDQMLENTARSLHGYLHRRIGCLDGILASSNGLRFLDADHIKSIFSFKTKSEDETIPYSTARKSNLRDFKELELQEQEDDKVFLEGALKISRTSFSEPFKFRGRISRPRDFKDVTNYLRTQRNMVILKK